MSSQFFETREKCIFANPSHFMGKKIKRNDDLLIHDFLLIFRENKQIDLCGKGLRKRLHFLSFQSFCFSWQREKEEISAHK